MAASARSPVMLGATLQRPVELREVGEASMATESARSGGCGEIRREVGRQRATAPAAHPAAAHLPPSRPSPVPFGYVSCVALKKVVGARK